jgi:hypothetical protein
MVLGLHGPKSLPIQTSYMKHKEYIDTTGATFSVIQPKNRNLKNCVM